MKPPFILLALIYAQQRAPSHLLAPTLALLKYAHVPTRVVLLRGVLSAWRKISAQRTYFSPSLRASSSTGERNLLCLSVCLSVCLSIYLCQRCFLARSTTCHALSRSRLSYQFCASLSLPSFHTRAVEMFEDAR